MISDRETTWKPGDLCVLGGGRSTFKVGYVVGSSRSPGKIRVASFSANKRRFSGTFVVPSEHVLPLPDRVARTLRHARTIRLAVIASAAERRALAHPHIINELRKATK